VRHHNEDMTTPLDFMPDMIVVPCQTSLSDVKQVGTSSYNLVEAKWAVSFANLFEKDSQYIQSIAIITPYASQRELLIALINEHRGTDSDNIPITIGTVDSFQGSEADVVIVSFVKFGEFTRHAQRMNVALTRARRKLIVLCPPKPARAERSMFHDLLTYSERYHAQASLEDLGKIGGERRGGLGGAAMAPAGTKSRSKGGWIPEEVADGVCVARFDGRGLEQTIKFFLPKCIFQQLCFNPGTLTSGSLCGKTVSCLRFPL